MSNMKDKTLATFSTEAEAFRFIESNLMTNVIVDRDLVRRCTVLLGPAWGLLAPSTLARWMLQDDLLPRQVRMNLQLHRVIWPDKDRGV